MQALRARPMRLLAIGVDRRVFKNNTYPKAINNKVARAFVIV